MFDPLAKFPFQYVLQYLCGACDPQNEFERGLYQSFRDYCIQQGFIEPGGADDPGVMPRGGDGGGP